MNRRTLLPLILSISLCQIACTESNIRDVDYVAGYPAITEEELVNVVVEIPAGTNDKWMVDKASGLLTWEQEDGKPRVIQYLAYPANYGMIPRTSLPRALGGDNDPLDVLLLGPQVPRGKILQARPVGVLRLFDDGERDDKILAVQISGPLSDVVDLETLESLYPGTLIIIETWFRNYKGPDRVTSDGFGSADNALEVVREASHYYETGTGQEKSR